MSPTVIAVWLPPTDLAVEFSRNSQLLVISLSSRKSIVGAHDFKVLVIWHRTDPVITDQIGRSQRV